MDIQTDEYLETYGLRRKKFYYDKRLHHSYSFGISGKVYQVVIGSLVDESKFLGIGYRMPDGMAFPANGMAEVYFDEYFDAESFGDFQHVKLKGLAASVVWLRVALSVIAHFETYDVGGFVFSAAGGPGTNKGRQVMLEDAYDYLLGLKNEPRYNLTTGIKKKSIRTLLPGYLTAYKDITNRRACYVVIPKDNQH